MRTFIYTLISLILVTINVKADTVNIEAAAKKAAIGHGLDPELFIAILIVESNLRVGAYNSDTNDHGIGQINITTAKSFKLDIVRLKTDLEYSLNAAAIVLKDFQKRYKKKEPDMFYCRYNIGSGKLVGIKLRRCLKYIEKVEKAMLY